MSICLKTAGTSTNLLYLSAVMGTFICVNNIKDCRRRLIVAQIYFTLLRLRVGNKLTFLWERSVVLSNVTWNQIKNEKYVIDKIFYDQSVSRSINRKISSFYET